MIQQQESKFKRGFKTWADKKSISIRLDLGLYASSHLSAFDLCKHLGIPVYLPNEISGLSNNHLDHLLNAGSNSWSAVTIPLENNKHMIIHNPTHSPARQQSNLMHELAHILCGHTVSQDILDTGLTRLLRCHNDEQEKEAEWFGGCLQLPRVALVYCLKKNMSLDQIATYYNSSKEMVEFRLNMSGAKKQVAYINKKVI